MANGYFERGEMYDILFSDGFDGEMAAHRPGIIVSSDRGNESNPTVLMVYTTTTTTLNKRLSINHDFVMNGWKNYALCNQIVTVNKTRLKKFYGKLSQSDMECISKCIQEAMSLDFVDETALKEKDNEIKNRDVLIGDLRTEMAGVKAEIGKKEDEIASLKMEIEMWQKCYGRCMDMLVETKVSADVARRTAKVEPKKEEPQPPVEEPKPEITEDSPVVEEPESEKLDINSCTITALKKAGIVDGVATKIVRGRPWKSVDDLKGTVGIKATTFGIVKEKLCCVAPIVEEDPVVDEVTEDSGARIDINTASAPEELTKKAEAKVKEKPQLELTEKLNLNTVTGRELMDKLRINECYAYSITSHRNKNGLYKSLEELKNVKGVPKIFYEKYKDYLTI